MLWINFKGPPKSEVSNVCDKILRFVDLQPLDPKFHLALEPKVLKLEDTPSGIKPSSYVPPGRIVIRKGRETKG